jgi:AraC-like DNA-binding protein
MRSKNITLSADDYLAKPFNMQEATMRFNQVLGLGAVKMNSNLIEGAETRMLEDHNTSMTTATESIDGETIDEEQSLMISPDDPMNMVETSVIKKTSMVKKNNLPEGILPDNQESEESMSDYSMLDAMDQQLIKNIEQYVMQNMSRGQISLEEMASAMGMGRVPFFHRVRNLTGKTPAELVRDMRLKHACILLKRTNINMSELATNVGFMTAENFISIFREKFGMTPLEYRLNHRK